MTKVIYCFSGTGNCMHAAHKMAEALGDTTVISMRNNPVDVPAMEAEVIGFVFPVYHWSLPRQAKEFIQKVQVNKEAYIFGITVCGGVAFNTLYDFSEILKEKGCQVSYTSMVKTVSSYVAAYEPFPNPKKILPEMEKALEVVCQELCSRKHTASRKKNYLLAGIRSIVQPHFVNELPTKDKHFNVSDECVSCGLCEKICIAKNISMVDGSPTFQHHCAQCMACIAYCPKGAINYKNITQKRTKYHHPDVIAVDLIQEK